MNKILSILLLCLFLFNCKKSDDLNSEDSSSRETNSQLNISPSKIECNVRESADYYFSIIKGGTPPYTILDSFSVAASAKIASDTLYVYPNKPGFTQLGPDSLSIIDNTGKSIQLKVNVNSLFYEYKTIDSASITVYGDTNFVDSFNDNFQTYWDAHTTEFRMQIGNNNASFRIQLNDVTSTGTYKVSLVYYNPLWDNHRIQFINKDSLQEVTFTKLDSQSVKVNLDVDAYDQSNYYNGEINISGSFFLTK